MEDALRLRCCSPLQFYEPSEPNREPSVLEEGSPGRMISFSSHSPDPGLQAHCENHREAVT